MSKVSGRAGSHKREEQARRPDTGFLKKRAFEKRTLPEPAMVERPKAYISGRSPLRAFYYTKTARGRWHTADRVTRGTKWNAYLCSGTAIPKGTRPEVFKSPPAVSGLLSAMMAAQERSHSREHLHGHHHSQASHVLMPHHHTTHSRSSLDTGWLDVPMPGALTQFQQGAYVKLEIAREHSYHAAPAVREQAEIPTMRMSLQAMRFELAPAKEQHITIHNAKQHPQLAAYESASEARAPEALRQSVPAETQKPASHAKETLVQIRTLISEPVRLHFGAVQEEKSDSRSRPAPKTAKTAAGPKPQEFRAEIPRSEDIRDVPEIVVQAFPTAPEYAAQAIRLEEITLPPHIGYIPSVRKKERQLKIALGAEGIPPQ